MALPGFLYNGPETAAMRVVLAHGAGAPMDSPFMEEFARAIGNNGFRVIRFEFPYMGERRLTGKRKPPNRAPQLMETWNAVIDHFGSDNLIIGGKSMGGRMASMVAAERDVAGSPVSGLVCLGYPFHPPGKPDNPRMEHLTSIQTPTLICQGARDTMGALDEVNGYALSPAVRLHWLEDGDHGFKPRKKSGLTENENWQSAIDAITRFAGNL